MRIFVQGEGIVGVRVLEVEEAIQVREVVSRLTEFGFPLPEVMGEMWIGLEDNEGRLLEDEWIRFEDEEDVRIHCHRCHRISVSCTFNGRTVTKDFPPSATMNAIKTWVVGPNGFNMPAVDAANHSLQVCGTTVKPGPNVHIGTLVKHPNCTLCLELVPSDRHQG